MQWDTNFCLSQCKEYSVFVLQDLGVVGAVRK